MFVNERNLSKSLNSKLNDSSIEELSQMWMFFQLNRYGNLSESFVKNFRTEKSKDFFKNGLNYEIIIKDKLQNIMTLNHFWNAVNLLDKTLTLTKESKLLLSENIIKFNKGSCEKSKFVSPLVFYS